MITRTNNEKTKEILEKLRLPTNCNCGDPVCNKTHEVRFTHEERDALKVAISYYLADCAGIL
jgi:hypothetical protein